MISEGLATNWKNIQQRGSCQDLRTLLTFQNQILHQYVYLFNAE